MKLLDIVINALRAMGDNFDDDILNSTGYDELSNDDRYRDRVINMLPALNRGLTRAYQLNYFSPKIVSVADITGADKLIDLSKLKDYGGIVGVYDNGGLAVHMDIMGNKIFANSADKVVYTPYVQIVINNAADWGNDIAECGLDEPIANALPLYIKYELFQQDDANLAKAARDDYDSLISRQPTPAPRLSTQTEVKLVYSCKG